MVTVTLVYPYFQPSNDNSIFRFPPLGLGYLAASLKEHNVPVEMVDCTFKSTRSNKTHQTLKTNDNWPPINVFPKK